MSFSESCSVCFKENNRRLLSYGKPVSYTHLAEITDALADVKNGNGNRRILSATNELVAPLAYEINEIVVSLSLIHI